MKKVLITGGAGYLGTVMVPLLLSEGYNVRIADEFYYGREYLDELAAVENNLELMQGDLCNDNFLESIFTGIDYVIHLASISNDPSGDLNPDLTERVNFGVTRKIVDLCVKNKIKKFIFASSCSVYGSGDFIDESGELQPVSLYAKTKIRSEAYIIDQVTKNNFPGIIFRMSTLYGDSPRMRFDLAVNVMTLNAVTKGKIFVLGGGTQWRPFLHVKDASNFYLKVLQMPKSKLMEFYGKPFNLGFNENNILIKDLAESIKKVLPEVLIENVPSDPDKRNYRVSFDFANRVFGVKQAHSVRDSIREIASKVKLKAYGDTTSEKFYTLKVYQRLLAVPVKDGGLPVRGDLLLFAKPSLNEFEENEVLSTLRSGWITMGPKVELFEKKISNYADAEYTVSVNSCTAALHLSLVAAGIKSGDEVITSPITWPATANVIIHCGATPVFVDVDPHTLNMDVSQIEAKINKNTRAIIPVHMAGRPCDLDGIRKIAKKHNLIVIEDAAHAIGAEYKGKKIGSISDFTCYSFYPIKNMTTGEGGAITVKSSEVADKLKMLRLHGVSKDAWKRYSGDGFSHSLTVYPGFKCNMTDLQAAIGIHQIDKLDAFIERREKIVEKYYRELSNLPELELLSKPSKDIKHAWHLFIIKLNLDKISITRDEFIQKLREENIGFGIHFISLHLHPYYADTYGYKPEDFKNANDASNRIISLPLYPSMSDTDVNQVVAGVKKLLNYYKK